MGTAFGSGMTFLGAMNSTMASIEAEKAMREATKAKLEEDYRLASEVRLKAQEDRSDRAREADQEFAAMQVAMVEGGGLGTISLLRIGGDIGAAEGRDQARIRHNEVSAVQALYSGARTSKQEYQSYKTQARYQRRQIAIKHASDQSEAGEKGFAALGLI